jgi:hypothetical protein
MRKFTGLALIAALFVAEGVIGQEKQRAESFVASSDT